MGNLVVPVDDKLYSTMRCGTDAFPFWLVHDDLDNYAQGFVNWHRQPSIEISYVLEGSVRVCLLNEEHLLCAGESFALLPDALHSIQPVAGLSGRYFTLIFEPNLLTGYPGSFFDESWYAPVAAKAHRFQQISVMDAAPLVHEKLMRIYESELDSSPLHSLDVQRLLQDIWILLAPHMVCTVPGKNSEDARILGMLNYLRAHFAEKFSLSRMAEEFHISRGECCRYFKRMMGMTIMNYLIDYRLSRAAELLKNERKSMTEIALLTGFSSPSSFSAAFHQKTGLTPSDFRKTLPPHAQSFSQTSPR